MKLIPTEHFILELDRQLTPQLVQDTGKLPSKQKAEYFQRSCKYAKFISQVRHLRMFIFSDEAGNVLVEPDRTDFLTNKFYKQELQQYQAAKERVLFEGWSLKDSEHITNGDHVIDIVSWTFYPNGLGSGFKFETLSDISKYGLELTKTAKSKIEN